MVRPGKGLFGVTPWQKRRRERRRQVERRLVSEGLEPRHLMASDIDIQFRDVGLLHDSGQHPDDGISANWAIRGTVQGHWANYRLFVEYDKDLDGQPDGVAATYQIPDESLQQTVFVFDPRHDYPELASYEGPITLAYRASLQADGQAVLHQEWHSFSFTASPVPPADENLRSLVLKHDTGPSATDQLTWIAIVTAQLQTRSDSGHNDPSGGGFGPDDPSDPGAGGGFDSSGGGLSGGQTGSSGGAGDPSGSGGFTGWGGSFGSGDPSGYSGGQGSGSGAFDSSGSSPPSPEGGLPSTGNSGSSPGSSGGSGTSSSSTGNSFLPSDAIPDFVAPDQAPLNRLAIEWDWNGDNLADARTWLAFGETAELDLSDLPYGEHTVRARVLQWDSRLGTARYSDWKSLTFYYVAAPAPEIVELGLVNDTGTPNDKVTSDTRLVGRLTEHVDDEPVLVYWDSNDDGVSDGYVLADDQGNFEIEPRGIAPGPVQVNLRTSRWDVKAQAELFGDWYSFSYTYQPDPPPSIASLDFRPNDRATGTASRLAGVLSGAQADVVIEFDDNHDGTPDAVAVTRSDGSFERVLIPSGSGTFTVHVRTRLPGGQRERTSDWREFSYRVDTSPLPELALVGLHLLRDTGLDSSDGVSSDGRLAGKVISSPRVTWKWVELDYDQDGSADLYSLAADDGQFLLYPDLTEFGALEWSVRAGAIDPQTAQLVRTAWHTIRWHYAPDPIVAPQITEVALAVNTGDPTDRVSSIPWLKGQVADTQGRATFLEVDLGSDNTVDQVAVVSADGSFLLRPTLVEPGPVAIRLRPTSWDDQSQQPISGQWEEVTLIYQLDVSSPAAFVETIVEADFDATLPQFAIGGIVAALPSAVRVALELDTDNDGEPDRVESVEPTGAFRFHVTTSAGESITVRIRTKQITDEGQIIYGQWEELRLTPAPSKDLVQPPVPIVLERVTELRLVNDTAASSSDLATSDPRVMGRLDAGQRASRLVEFDLDGDGRPEGVVTTGEDGTFTIDPAPMAEGLIRLAVRPVVDSGTTTIWSSLAFVYATDPDSESSQQLARLAADYQATREAAMDEYWRTLKEAVELRHRKLGEAANQRNAEHRQHNEALGTGSREVEQRFYEAVQEIDEQYAASLRAAAERFAEQIGSSRFDRESSLPELVWPEAPPDGRGPLRETSRWAPPFALSVPRLEPHAARLPSQATLAWQRALQTANQELQRNDIVRIADDAAALRQFDDAHLESIERSRQQWLQRVRTAQARFDQRRRETHPTIDLVLSELKFQQALQQAENVYQAALQAHQRALANRLAPLQEALKSAIDAAIREYERRMQELSDFYAQNPPSYPMEYSDFEKAWRKRAFSDRETAIADAYLAFDRAVADAYRIKERQDAEALYQRDMAITIAEEQLTGQKLAVAIWSQQNQQDAWNDYQTELVSAENAFLLAAADASLRHQLHTAEQLLRNRLRQIEQRKGIELRLVETLREAWPEEQLPDLAELALARQLDQIDTDFQHQLAKELARLDVDVAQAIYQWQQDVARAEHVWARTIQQATDQLNQQQFQSEAARRQNILNAVSQEARAWLAEQTSYRQQLVNLRRTRDLDVADENHRFALERAQIAYDYLLERRDVHLDYMGEMRDTPIDVPLAEAARRHAHRLARAENTHRHNRLAIDERWSDGTLAALLLYRLKLHHWAEQRTSLIVQADYVASDESLRHEALFAETTALDDIQYEVDRNHFQSVLDTRFVELDADREIMVAQLGAAREAQVAAALAQFGRQTTSALVNGVASWIRTAGVPEPWASYYTVVATGVSAWAGNWYTAQQQRIQAQGNADAVRVQAETQAFRLAHGQIRLAETQFVLDAASAARQYASGRAAALVQTGVSTTVATRDYLVDLASAERFYADAWIHAGVVHDESVRDAFFGFEHDAADALLALQLEQVDQAGYVALLETAAKRRRVAEASAYVQLVTSVTAAADSFTASIAAADVAHVRRLAQSAVQDVTTETSLRAQVTNAQLLAWQTREATIDQATAQWLRRQASFQTTWALATTTDANVYRQTATLADTDYRSTISLAEGQYQVTSLEQRATTGIAATELLTAQHAPRLPIELSRYQSEVAAADAHHARRELAARQRKLKDEYDADALWLAALSQADFLWADSLRAAYEEWVAAFTAASTQYAADARQVVANYLSLQVSSQGQADRDTIAAYAQAAEAAAQARADYLVTTAQAMGRLLRLLAHARADLYVAGESDDVEGKDPASLSPAQRAYVHALQAASQQWLGDSQAAGVQYASALGTAWVGLHTDLGHALQRHAQQVNLAEQQAAWGSSAAELRFSILVTTAARRFVDRITDAFTARDLAEATAREAWIHDRVRAELDYLQQLGQADRQRARRLALAQVQYFVGITDQEDHSSQVRRTWFQLLQDPYVVYQERLAGADAAYREATARLEGHYQQQIAALERQRILDRASIRDSHAQQLVDAMATFQLSALPEQNRLVETATQADSTRRTAYADALADHGVAVATADKQLWIALAAGFGSNSQAEQLHRIQVAAATRQASRAFADADHTWSVVVSAAETWHLEQLAYAAASLEKTVAQADSTARTQLARAEADWLIGVADAQSDRALDRTHAVNRWRLERARAEADWTSQILSGRRTVWNQFASESDPSSYQSYQLTSAALADQWWATARDSYVDRVARENHINLQFTLDVGQAYRTLNTRLAAGHVARESTLAGAQQQRRQAHADARTVYVQQLVNPALATDRSKADAIRDYRYALADAQHDLTVGGSMDDYQRKLADAARRQQQAIAAADAFFARQEAAAMAHLRTTNFAADLQERQTSAQAETDWVRTVQQAMADWNETVFRLETKRTQALQQIDFGTQTQWDQPWAEILTTAAPTNNPWLERQRVRAQATARHLDYLHRARTEHDAAWADLQLEWLSLETAADRRWIDRQADAATELDRTQAEQLNLLSRPQQTAELSLAAAGLPAQSTPWASWLPEMGFWVPGGSSWILPVSALALVDLESLLESALAGLAQSPIVAPPMSSSTTPVFAFESPGLIFPPVAYPTPEAWPSGPVVPAVPARYSSMRPGEYYERMELESQANVPNGMYAAAPASPWQPTRFLEDLGLILKYPGAAWTGFREGTETSTKVLVNGTATTLRSTVTLGFNSNPWEIIKVTESDRFYGYDTAFGIMRVSQELLLGAALGKASQLHVNGWGSVAVHGLRYWDVAQNTASMARGAYAITSGEGLNWQNGLELLGGAVGMSGHMAAAFRAWHQAEVAKAIQAANRGSPYRIGVSVILQGRNDIVGHVMILFEDRTPRIILGQPGKYEDYVYRVVRGMYSVESIDHTNPGHLLKFFFGGKIAGFRGQIENDEWIINLYKDTDALLETRWFPVSQKQFYDALEFVWKTEELAQQGRLRYHVFSQCAVFARRTLQAAGLKPFYKLVYPPWVYRLLERMPQPRRASNR